MLSLFGFGAALAAEPEPSTEPPAPPVEAPADTAPTDPAPPAQVPPPTSTVDTPTPLAAAPPAPAARPQLGWSFQDDFKLRYWIKRDRLPNFPDKAVFNYAEQVNRLIGNFNLGKSSGFVQIDEVALFANHYYLDDELYAERDLTSPELWNPWPGSSYLNLEKVRFTYKTGKIVLDVGDTYAAFGRGLALNVNRNVDIDIDTSIQGAKLVAHAGDWDVTAIAGMLNRQQVFQENPNLGLRPDYRHGVAGFRVDRYGLGPASIGAHAVAYDFVQTPGAAGLAEYGTPDAVIGGANVELLGVGGLDWYVEGNAFGYPTTDLTGGVRGAPGYGLYASVAAYLGPTTWLLEGKRYTNTDRMNTLVAGELYRVSVPPTLEYERVITEDSSAAVASNDIWGTRLRCDISAIPGVLTPYVAVQFARDLDLGTLHFNTVPETIIDPIIGVEALGETMSLIANAGYRTDDRDGTDWGSDRMLYGDLDWKFPLPWHLEGDATVAGRYFSWGKNPLQQADFQTIESAVTVQHGSEVAVIGYLDYTNNPLVNTIGNLNDRTYGAVEVQIKPKPAWTFKAFYGAYKAGIRCSGGQCRQLPGFEGARVTASLSF
jgi:hypothetical protein